MDGWMDGWMDIIYRCVTGNDGRNSSNGDQDTMGGVWGQDTRGGLTGGLVGGLVMKAMNEWVGGLVDGCDRWTGRLVGACDERGGKGGVKDWMGRW